MLKGCSKTRANGRNGGSRDPRARAPGGERGFGLYRPREDPQGLQSKVLDSCCGVLLLGAEWFEVSLVVAAISLMSDSNGKEIDEGLLFWRRFIVDSHQVQVQDMLKDDLSQSTVMRRDPSHARARVRAFSGTLRTKSRPPGRAGALRKRLESQTMEVPADALEWACLQDPFCRK